MTLRHSAALAAAASLPTPECLRSCHLFDQISDAVLVAKLPSTDIVLWNAAASRIFGYSQAEAAGLRLVDLIAEPARESFQSSIRGVQNSGRWNSADWKQPVELRGRRKDGHEFAPESTFGPLQSGEPAGSFVLVILREISHRKATAATLRILRDLAAPLTIAGRTLHIRASVGIAMFPRHGEDINALTEAADQAMFRAKRAGVGLALSGQPTGEALARHWAG